MNTKSHRFNKSTAEKLERDSRVEGAPAHATHLKASTGTSIALPSKLPWTNSPVVNVQPNSQLNIVSLERSQQDAPLSVAEMEWARIAPDKVVVATAERAWLHRLDPARNDDPFAQPMVGVGSVATTQRLLDGVILLACRNVESICKPPALTRTRWVWRLAGFYHLCHSTPQLMEEASQRFASGERWSLARWAVQKAKEETGHDKLALLDIQSMGYKAEAVVKAFVPPAAKALVDYFAQSAQDSDPINCVGYSYTAERLAVCIGEEYIHSVEALLPSHINATRCLRVHSAVSSTEVKHVKETIAMIAELTPQERVRVAQACYEAALLRFSPPQEPYISDEEIQNALKLLDRTNSNR